MRAARHPLLRVALWLGLAIALGAFSRMPAFIQADSQITSNQATVDFPRLVSFSLEGVNTPAVETVILHYGTESRSCQPTEAQQSFEINPGDLFEASWDWELKRSGAIPPGAEIWWEWELKHSNGETRWTDRKTLTIEDTRHAWRSLRQGDLRLQWYEGDQAFGSSLLAIAADGMARLETFSNLPPGQPIRLVVYPSAEEVREALIHTYEWTGGVAIPEYHTTILAIAPGELTWARSVIPHELSHLVIGELVFNCRGARLPTWMSEGLAEYAEGTPTASRRRQVRDALEADNLPPLRSLSRGFSAYSEAASLSYAYSAIVADFLISEYGPAPMQQLLAQLQAGEGIDPALEAVYGFDTRGLDRAWRASLGFGDPVPEAVPTREEASPTPIPTLALWTPLARPSPTTAAPTETLVAATPTPIPASPTPGSTQEPAPPESYLVADQASADGSLLWIGLGAGGGVLLAVVLIKLRKGEAP